MKRAFILWSIILSAYAGEIAIVTHKNSPFVPLPVVRDIYLGENSAMSPADQTKISETFYLKLHGLPMSKIRRIWGILVFTGRADRPQRFNSDDEIITWVSDQIGRIGYIDKKSVTKDIRVLHVLQY